MPSRCDEAGFLANMAVVEIAVESQHGLFHRRIDALDQAVTVGLVREHDAGRLVFTHDLVRRSILDALSR